MEHPLVSIIIPSYNSSKVVLDAIDSAISQTYENIEVIVVNDGSTDDTLSKLSALSIPNLFVISQENGGLCSARNTGWRNCHGEYVKFLDADDELLPDAITQEMTAIKDFASKDLSVAKYIMNGGKDRLSWQGGLYYILQTLLLFPIGVLQEIGGYDENMRFEEDTEMTFRLLSRGYNLIPIDVVSYNYRNGINEGSITSKPRKYDTLIYFYRKYEHNHFQFISDKEYNRFFIIFLFDCTRPIDNPSAYYYWLRKRMPYKVHPACFLYSRLKGYIVWYFSYFFSYNKVVNFISIL